MRPSQGWISEEVQLEVFDETANAEIILTESGDIEVNLEETLRLSQSAETLEGEHELRGVTSDGVSIRLEDTFVGSTPIRRHGDDILVDVIRPAQIVIHEIGDNSLNGEKVTIGFDMVCFKPDIRSEEDPLLKRDDWTVFASTLDDIESRIDCLREFRTAVRTGSVRFEQCIEGGPEEQYQYAEERLSRIIELLSYSNGVRAAPIRARITHVDEEEMGERKYTRYISDYRTDLGGRFKGWRIFHMNDRQFLQDTYGNYVSSSRKTYALHIVFSWYLDSLNPNRTLNSRFLSLTSAIELFATRHADKKDYDPQDIGTPETLRRLIAFESVNTDDLVNHSTLDLKVAKQNGLTIEYFYNMTRNYLTHGSYFDDVGPDEILRDYPAVLVLLQRLIRNELVDEDVLKRYRPIRIPAQFRD